MMNLYRKSMGAVAEQIKAIDPLIPFVYSVMIGDSPKQDADAGFFDIVSRQVAHVCETLSEVALCLLTKQVHGLEHGFNAVGFSQVRCRLSKRVRVAFFSVPMVSTGQSS